MFIRRDPPDDNTLIGATIYTTIASKNETKIMHDSLANISKMVIQEDFLNHFKREKEIQMQYAMKYYHEYQEELRQQANYVKYINDMQNQERTQYEGMHQNFEPGYATDRRASLEYYQQYNDMNN